MERQHERRRCDDKRWGVFRRDDGQVDIAPCDRRGRLAPGHVLGGRCGCKPRVEREQYYVPVFIHDSPITEPTDDRN